MPLWIERHYLDKVSQASQQRSQGKCVTVPPGHEKNGSVFIRADPCPTKTKIKSIPIYLFQSTIVNHKSSIPMRPPLHACSTSQRYRCGISTLVIVFVHYVARSFCETIKLAKEMPKIAKCLKCLIRRRRTIDFIKRKK
jgi:hypothetical protein